MTKLNYVNPVPHLIMDRVALRNLTHRTAKKLAESLPSGSVKEYSKALYHLNRVRQAISVVDTVLDQKWSTEAAKAFKVGVQRPYQ